LAGKEKTETKRLARVLTVRHGTKHGIARSLRHSTGGASGQGVLTDPAS
jgi:hypothetical protein